GSRSCPRYGTANYSGAPRTARLTGTVSPPSLPGLTPQVGFTRLAARCNAELGQARVPMQSIFFFAQRPLRSGLTRGSSPRVTPENGQGVAKILRASESGTRAVRSAMIARTHGPDITTAGGS